MRGSPDLWMTPARIGAAGHAPGMEIDTTRPFRRAEAIAAGISPRVLDGPRYRRIFQGVYIDSAVLLTPELRVEAALLPFQPTAFASHTSAARLYGVPIPAIPDEHVSVVDRGHRRTRRGIRCHLSPEPGVRTVRGIRVSAVDQMFVELAELLSLVDVVLVGDHLVKRRLVTVDDLQQYCAMAKGPGARSARDAVRYVRDRVDPPMETRLRMLIVLAGLPEPEVNVSIRDENGVPLRRYDLRYRESRTVVEYDGRQHIDREANWEADIERREDIEADGDRVIVVTAKGIYGDPERTLHRIWTILRKRGEPGVPLRLSDDWRPHFPVWKRTA